MYPFSLFLSGGFLALMLALNGQLSQAAGLAPALVLIHVSGLIASLPLLRFDSNASQAAAKKPAWWLYSAGTIGVGLTLMDLYCVMTLGVTLTVALKLLGQLWGAFLFDISGLPGIPKRKLRPERLLTLILATLGCLIMTSFEAINNPVMGFALLSGLIQSLTAVLNGALGAKIGNFRAVSYNFATGLFASLPVLWLFGVQPVETFRTLSELSPLILIGGGVCAVLVVGARTVSFPHVSMLTATLLLLIGQLGAGTALDFWAGRDLQSSLLNGALVMLLGLSAEGLVDYGRKTLVKFNSNRQQTLVQSAKSSAYSAADL